MVYKSSCFRCRKCHKSRKQNSNRGLAASEIQESSETDTEIMISKTKQACSENAVDMNACDNFFTVVYMYMQLSDSEECANQSSTPLSIVKL